MQRCDICQSSGEVFSVPGTEHHICDECIKAGRIEELFETPAFPADPIERTDMVG
jgi:hypothetical protein